MIALLDGHRDGGCCPCVSHVSRAGVLDAAPRWNAPAKRTGHRRHPCPWRDSEGSNRQAREDLMHTSGCCSRTAGHQMSWSPIVGASRSALKLQAGRSRTGGGCLQGRHVVAPRRFVVACANKGPPWRDTLQQLLQTYTER
jgi:hypothetical protein